MRPTRKTAAKQLAQGLAVPMGAGTGEQTYTESEDPVVKPFAVILLLASALAGQQQPGSARPPRQLVHTAAAEYSPQAREARLQGTVALMLEVTPEGSVAAARVKRGLGMGLDARAIDAAMTWTYAPDPDATGNQIIPAEVPLVLDPRGAWQVAGAKLFVNTENVPGHFLANGRLGVPEIVKPRFAKYAPPDALVCSGLHSFITVNLQIREDGLPTDIHAVPAKPEDAGETATVEQTAQRWTFEPATADGNPRPASGAILMECNGTGATENDRAGAAMRAGNGVTPPDLIFKVEPDYSEAARKAKLQGDITLSLIVEPDGRPSNIRVTRGLGSGLDEEAVAALMQWRFLPGMKDGQAVRVMAQVNVKFRLL